MSSRIREIVQDYPEINIIHRSHPLRWDNQEEVNSDWEKKWEIANRIDEKHRFNIEGMKEKDFKMPTARLAMIAIRAGTLAGGDEWALFDRFQEALYVENLNIADEEVIAQIITDAGIDFKTFLKYYEDPETERMEEADFKRAEKYELELIPALVVEEKHVIEGTKRSDLALELLKEAAEKEGIKL
jgi:predicted DsbA family dithiol-disulfide isomerase